MYFSPAPEPSINVTFVATSTLGELRGADFTDIARLDRGQLEAILDLAGRIKAGDWRQRPLTGRANALTDASHPCQVLADLLTMREVLGRLDESTPVAFVGDGNNVVSSLMEAATVMGFPLTVISPPAYRPSEQSLARAHGVTVTGDL